VHDGADRAFPGRWRWPIYDCLISDADPDLLCYEQIQSSLFRRCYVYDGQPVDVTWALHEIVSRQKASGHSPDRFACLDNVASASS
jgi:hypothetical protein